ncbi:protein of unknown function DUF421 [Syntrophobotulus glycolicus DSM 8271]|uniref:YetF C-terminal domain-containing protein n=1 Tax=Syntrophobotulus glycolicus (strain DSM 8271 / FlGlyR) TaxID=645991 RepID=F0T059_SYNGF|nr:DUF421 domain-containing protein [Syntrophobotulus glycolicus]ADY56146.1 protein of unknown function DUF421 [Syntrophobotulus glycolicus DSM 8271]
MIIATIRTIILYLVIVIIIRIMGKKQIGQLQPFELVIILMISELAAIPSQNIGIPLSAGLLPVIVLLLLGMTFSYITLKSEKARALICGTPTILIEKGKIIEKELVDLKYNLSDLLEQLRVNNIPNIADVEYAILETNGQLSVIPKTDKRPLTPADMNIHPAYEGLPSILIMDGIVQKRNLERSNANLTWLKNELNKANLKVNDVLIASLDNQNHLYFQAKKSNS